MNTPLMPKATAVWLVENTILTFEQIADFCKLHPLEIQGIADDEVAIGIVGLDPMTNGQLTKDEIERCVTDPSARLQVAESGVPRPRARAKGARYTPLSKRQDRPDAISWALKFHPEISDAQIVKLLGTTKATINAVRERTHWNSSNIKPQDPVSLGICTQAELDEAVTKAQIKLRAREAREAKEQAKAERAAAAKREAAAASEQAETPKPEAVAPTPSPFAQAVELGAADAAENVASDAEAPAPEEASGAPAPETLVQASDSAPVTGETSEAEAEARAGATEPEAPASPTLPEPATPEAVDADTLFKTPEAEPAAEPAADASLAAVEPEPAPKSPPPQEAREDAEDKAADEPPGA